MFSPVGLVPSREGSRGFATLLLEHSVVACMHVLQGGGSRVLERHLRSPQCSTKPKPPFAWGSPVLYTRGLRAGQCGMQTHRGSA